jgi:hypothetical protein
VAIEEVLYTAPGITVKAGDVIPLTTWAKKPPQPGQLRLMMADGPSYPDLQPDERCLIIVGKLPAEAGYMAQPSFASVRRLDEAKPSRDWLARIRKVANVRQWAWGRPVNGLQLAFVPDTTEISLVRYRPAGKAEQTRAGRVMFAAVLRNAGDKPITVNLFPGDHILSLRDGGKPVPEYAAGKLPQQPFTADGHLYQLQPGELLSVARHGKAPHGDGVQPDNSPHPRAYSLQYRSQRAGCWQGELESAVVRMTVVEK